MNKQTDISDIELRQIRVFRAVAECKGITSAELVLNKGKSAISTDISDLEQRLGMKLFKRKRGDFSLTEQGEMVYEAAQKLVGDVEQFRQAIHSAQTNLTGRLNLYLADNAIWDNQLELTEVIAAYHDLQPGVFLNITSGNPNEVAQAVLNGHADLGIDVLPRKSSSLNCVPIYKEELFLYCGAKHPLFDMDVDELTIDILSKYEFIGIVALEDKRLEKILEGCRITAAASTLDMRASMILSGKFLGFLPGYMAQHWLKQKQMRALMPDHMYTSSQVYAITNVASSCNPARDSFLKVLEDVEGRK